MLTTRRSKKGRGKTKRRNKNKMHMNTYIQVKDAN
jgi:hypothetical protein